MKKLNYMVGAFKRRFKMGRGDFKPGALMEKLNESKAAKKQASLPSVEKVAFKGLV